MHNCIHTFINSSLSFIQVCPSLVFMKFAFLHHFSPVSLQFYTVDFLPLLYALTLMGWALCFSLAISHTACTTSIAFLDWSCRLIFLAKSAQGALLLLFLAVPTAVHLYLPASTSLTSRAFFSWSRITRPCLNTKHVLQHSDDLGGNINKSGCKMWSQRCSDWQTFPVQSSERFIYCHIQIQSPHLHPTFFFSPQICGFAWFTGLPWAQKISWIHRKCSSLIHTHTHTHPYTHTHIPGLLT